MDPTDIERFKPFKSELSFYHHQITEIDFRKLSIFLLRLLNTNC